MRLKIPYKIYPDAFGPPDAHLYSAMLSVQIALSSANAPRTRRFEAVIDSGATRTLFHADFLSHLGVDLAAGEVEITQGIGGRERTYLHEIALYIPGGPVKIKAAFKDGLPVAGLLGMQGFFEFFKVSFDPDARACELDRVYRA
jgi:hypothetical protein